MPAARETVAPPVEPNRLVPCPGCKVMVRASNLQRHFSKVHRGLTRSFGPRRVVAVSASAGLYRPTLSIFADRRWSAKRALQGGRPESNRRKH